MFKGGSKASKKSISKEDEAKLAAIQQIFNTYADPDEPETICVDDSFGQLCDDIGIDGGADVRAVVLLWRLGAARKNADKPMTISRDVFTNRMAGLNSTSVEALKALMPSFDTGFLESEGVCF
jgi:hypothetical protein